MGAPGGKERNKKVSGCELRLSLKESRFQKLQGELSSCLNYGLNVEMADTSMLAIRTTTQGRGKTTVDLGKPLNFSKSQLQTEKTGHQFQIGSFSPLHTSSY